MANSQVGAVVDNQADIGIIAADNFAALTVCGHGGIQTTSRREAVLVRSRSLSNVCPAAVPLATAGLSFARVIVVSISTHDSNTRFHGRISKNMCNRPRL
jgi:hypothetical protein